MSSKNITFVNTVMTFWLFYYFKPNKKMITPQIVELWREELHQPLPYAQYVWTKLFRLWLAILISIICCFKVLSHHKCTVLGFMLEIWIFKLFNQNYNILHNLQMKIWSKFYRLRYIKLNRKNGLYFYCFGEKRICTSFSNILQFSNFISDVTQFVRFNNDNSQWR